jgi:hypothetical protein
MVSNVRNGCLLSSSNLTKQKQDNEYEPALLQQLSAPPFDPLCSLRETSRSVYDELFWAPNERTLECFAIVSFEFFTRFVADDGVDNEED